MQKQKSIPAITADQMKEVDNHAVKIGLEVMQMMEHAAFAMSRLVAELFPNASKILIIAGKGNNSYGQNRRNSGVN